MDRLSLLRIVHKLAYYLPFMSDFESEMFSHYYWFETAERLKISAEVLYDKLSDLYDREQIPENLMEWRKQQLAVFQSHMMLLGFSLENLVKAVSVKTYTSKNGLVTDFKSLQNQVWQVKNAHDLLSIAENCNFELTDNEKDLIERHTEFLVWAGRYHLPKNKLKYDEVFEQGKLRRKQGDHNLIESVFSKAKRFLQT